MNNTEILNITTKFQGDSSRENNLLELFLELIANYQKMHCNTGIIAIVAFPPH